MGCGASFGAKPLVVLDPGTFHTSFRKQGVKAGAWLSDTVYLYVLESGNLGTYDFPTHQDSKLATTGGEVVCGSPDCSVYAVGAKNEVQIFKVSDHSLVKSFSAPVDCIASMAFSPDAKFLAVESGKLKGLCVLFTAEGQELDKLQGQDGTPMTPVFYNNDTLLLMNKNAVCVYSLKNKAQVERWPLPEDEIEVTAVCMAGRKIFVGNMIGKVWHLEITSKLSLMNEYWIHPAMGVQNLQVLADEQTAFFEKPGGGHFKTYVLAAGEQHIFSRGDGDETDLAMLKSVRFNSSQGLLACLGTDGLEVFSVSREIEP
ncbi:unnamed protein product [Effrenium voratum]|nr:unnamed protein product [Effrenium voratum]|mmetsp:Transcript_136000/g.322251  ORF Transcript_136000/g.322251 Transcript_136000/m.322251 type:complete len:315 (-) Transcript_136000:38-982(-)|eukprot:CAMPEP_0181445648 /NCGR_PEP_ID=MMETSP1110-20121109/25695_1 /TAXON_ID=174948 /ORGANISM="Symbiodinium sp., Strain CCMP421" /LENGTH=314 /DNA_ID=CAMNT_0023569697 /DNA_START=35 /DNA_END=979 /DNA_ORIENTATION=+